MVRYFVEASWNVVAHAHKPDFVFRRNGRVHINRRGRRFSRLLAAEVCASAVIMLDTPCFGIVWRVLATHSIRQFPLHFPSRASPCAITFQLESTTKRQLPYSTALPLQHRRPYLRCINSTFQADIQHNLADPIARYKAWVYGRSLAGIADLSVRLLWALCVVRQMAVLRADHRAWCAWMWSWRLDN